MLVAVDSRDISHDFAQNGAELPQRCRRALNFDQV